ncbi:MAG: hypothetical protein K0R92_2638 [Lachnospiraceae bacterium]|nr:hypothetical protein [Lachnospiraceae bacterium]
MTFQFVHKGHSMLYMLEPNSVTIITYYSKHQMKRIYRNEEYEVIGEIGNIAKTYPNQDTILTETGNSIPVFPRGSLKRPFEWVTGYAAIGESTYVAVVKSILPHFLYKKKPKQKKLS